LLTTKTILTYVIVFYLTDAWIIGNLTRACDSLRS